MIYSIKKYGKVSSGKETQCMCDVEIISNNAKVVSIENGFSNIQHSFRKNKRIKIKVVTSIDGNIVLQTDGSVMVAILSVEEYKIDKNISVYVHGDRGDMLLAAGYIQTLIDTYSISEVNIFHGGSKNSNGSEVFNNNFKKMFGSVKHVTNKFITGRNRAKKFIPLKLRSSFVYFGPPGDSDSEFPHINKVSVVPNIWSVPRWLDIDNVKKYDIGIFRYSWSIDGKKSLDENINNILLTAIEKEKYNCILLGYKDPLKISNSSNIKSLINRTTIDETIKVISQCKYFITIDSFPATIAPRLEIPTSIIIRNEGQYYRSIKDHFHNISNITHLYPDNDIKNKWIHTLIKDIKERIT